MNVFVTNFFSESEDVSVDFVTEFTLSTETVSLSEEDFIGA